MNPLCRILYVDDETGVLETGKRFLESEGEFAVHTCTSAAEALTLLTSTQYDAIISGYEMPEMNGIDFLKAVRQQFGTIPFIFLTSRGREEIVIEAFSNGADFYLQKGGDPHAQFTELRHKVQQAIRKYQSERELTRNREYLNKIFSSVQAGIVLVDAKTHEIFDINPAAAEMVGLPKEQIIGHVCHNFICPAETGKCPITDLNQNVDNSERVLVTSEKEKIPIIKYVTRITRDNREYLLETFINNTERKQAENALIQKTRELHTAYDHLSAQEEELHAQYDAISLSQAEWESTFNAISDWICLITPEGKIIRTNTAAESQLGIPFEEVAGRYCFEFIHGTGTECHAQGCPRRRMLVSRKRETSEIQMFDKNRWVQITVDPVLNSAGAVVSAVHIVRDVTENVRSQKALEQAKKKLTLLNYVTFNDLQNLIFTLSGYQHLAKVRVTEEPTHSIIEKQEILLQKITHSLKFAQSYQNLGLKPPQWQNVNHVFLLAISHQDFLNIHHNVVLDGLEIFADPLLEQVFQILAENTLIHGRTATQLTFRYEQGPESLLLIFEDNGVGISDDIKEKIFLPDFQKKKGVGLFLAREILDITGITIRETGEPGKGARMEMTIPKGVWRFAGKQE